MIKSIAVASLAAVALIGLPAISGTATAAPAVTAKAVPQTTMIEQAARRYVVRHRVYRPYRPVYAYRPYRPAYIYRPWRPYYAYRPGVVISAGIPLYYGYRTARPSCSYSYRKWKHTGSRYWHQRYRRCRGW